jgi:hypothetical protein
MYMNTIQTEKVHMKRRLSIDIPMGIHNLLRTVCRRRALNITTWVIRAILEKLIRDGDMDKF